MMATDMIAKDVEAVVNKMACLFSLVYAESLRISFAKRIEGLQSLRYQI